MTKCDGVCCVFKKYTAWGINKKCETSRHYQQVRCIIKNCHFTDFQQMKSYTLTINIFEHCPVDIET